MFSLSLISKPHTLIFEAERRSRRCRWINETCFVESFDQLIPSHLTRVVWAILDIWTRLGQLFFSDILLIAQKKCRSEASTLICAVKTIPLRLQSLIPEL